MAEKRISVRLSATGGKTVRATLEGIGESARRGVARLSSELERANRRLAEFGKAASRAGKIAAAATGAGLAVLTAQVFRTVGDMEDLAESLGTTTASVQVLGRAAELAGLTMGDVQTASIALTRRLAQVEAGGAKPAAAALERLRVTGEELRALPVDERLALIQTRLAELVPAGERAAIAAALFGDRAGVAFSRVSAERLAQARAELERFGGLLSEGDVNRIGLAEEAVQRLGIAWSAFSNRLVAAAGPAIAATADALGALAQSGGPVDRVLTALGENIGRIAATAAAFAAFMAGRWVVGMIAAAASVSGVATALVVLRGAIIRTGIGALIVAAGEMIFQFGRLVTATGSWSEALGLLADVASEVWARIAKGGEAMSSALSSIWLTVRAAWVGTLSQMQADWASFLRSVNSGAEVLGLDPIFDAFGAETAAVELGNAADALEAQARRFAALGALQRGGLTAPLASVGRINDLLSRPQASTPPFVAPAITDPVADALGGGGGRGGAGATPAADPVQQIARAREETQRWGEQVDQVGETWRGVGESITGPLREMVQNFDFSLRGLRDAGSKIFSDLANRFITTALRPIEQALEQTISRLFSGGGGGGGGIFGTLLGALFGGLSGGLGGGAGGGGLLVGTGGLYAKGGAFSGGRVIPFARGGVVDGPTVFPMRGATGMMGERGPESIMPLRRTRGGDLGVQATPAPAPVVHVNVMLDPAELVSRGLSTRTGERAFAAVQRRTGGSRA